MRRRLGVLLLALPLGAQAQMYKCVDERGAVRYADQPGPGCKAAAIRASPPISGQLQQRSDDLATRDAEFRRRQVEEQARVARDREALGERCARLRQQQGILASGVRIGNVNASGERSYMDDASRERELASVREALRGCP